MFDQQEIKRAGFEEVLRQMPAAVMIVEAPSGETIFVSRQTQQMTERYLGRSGLSGVGDLHDLHHESIFELFHPDGRPYEVEEWPIMRSIRSGEEVRDEELVQRFADGTQLTLLCNSSPIRDEEGRIVAGVLIVHDITERKRAQETQARHVAILETTSDFVATADPDGRLLYINRAGKRVLGIGEDEDISNTSIGDYYPEWARKIGLEQGVPAAVRDGTWSGETALLSRDGREIPISQVIIAHKGPSGEVQYLSSISRDITEQKLAEEQLAYHAHLLENVHDAVLGTDEQFVLTLWNKGAQQMFGWTADEVLGRKIYEVIPTEYSDEEMAQALRDLSETGWFRGDMIMYHKDGTPVYTETLTIALREEQGEITGYINITRDITERKRAEEALRESNRRIENILESMTDAFFALDRQWRFTYINERALRQLQVGKDEQLTNEEVLGKNAWELFPELVGSVFYHKYHEALREQKTVEFEAYSQPSEQWLEVHAYPSEEGLTLYRRDISERKRAQKEIETRTYQQATVAELGLRAMAEPNLQTFMDDAATCVAQTLEIEYVKIVEPLPSSEQMLMRAGVGWREGLVGSATESAGLDSEAGYTLHSEEGPVIVEDMRTERRFGPSELIRDHEIVSGISVVIHGQEEPFGVLCAHAASHRTFSEDDSNFLQSVANVLATAIERKEAEERLEEVREVERSRIARDLHDDALQDLTDALVKVQLIQAISSDSEVSSQLGQLLAVLDRMGPHVRGAIYDLRLEAEQERPFSELLESLVELHRTMVPESEIRLQVGDGLLEGPLGKTGREVLRIVGEVLTNARRHSRARNVLVSLSTEEDKLWVEVSDDGRGFHPEKEPSATTPTGGMGIKGMRERARALGADLKIQSEPGRGTKVRLELDLKREPEQPQEEAVRVLLVEDHSAVRESLASTFEREAGFNIVGQAGSLAEARQMLEEVEPMDVAVVDLGLPDGYGADLIKELREASPQAQALVLSANLDRAEIARAVERGAAGVLHKTTHLEEVVEAVRRLRAGETLMPLEEVVELLRFASTRREEYYEARKAIARLTSREIEVLQALAEGLDSEGIAERLHISLRTERNHMANILAKLEVHSQLQALVFTIHHGVVEIP